MLLSTGFVIIAKEGRIFSISINKETIARIRTFPIVAYPFFL